MSTWCPFSKAQECIDQRKVRGQLWAFAATTIDATVNPRRETDACDQAQVQSRWWNGSHKTRVTLSWRADGGQACHQRLPPYRARFQRGALKLSIETGNTTHCKYPQWIYRYKITQNEGEISAQNMPKNLFECHITYPFLNLTAL